MSEIDIQVELVNKLKECGFFVIASEVDEGFPKPAVFVSVIPTIHERLMCDCEAVTDTVTITYYPAKETAAECVRVSDKIIDIFYYSPFRVNGHTFTVEKIETNIDEYILTVAFELYYEQQMPFTDEYKNTENISIGMDLEVE